MTARSQMRGHQTYYDEKSQEWRYVEDKITTRLEKPCTKCGKHPTKEGHDYCLRHLSNCDGIKSACCGHGKRRGFIMLKDGRVFIEDTIMADKEA